MAGPSRSNPAAEAAAIEARAAALRERWLHEQRTSRLDDHVATDRLSRAREAAKAGAADAEKDAAGYLDNAKATLKEAAAFEADAKKLELKNPAEAREYREIAAERRANAEEMTGLAKAAQAEGDRYRADADRLDKEYEAASDASVKHMVALQDAEIQIDHLEEKAASLRKAEQNLEYAEKADQDAVRLRAEGNQKAADMAVARAAKYRTDAETAQQAADAKFVDERAFGAAGLSSPTVADNSATEPVSAEAESANADISTSATPTVSDADLGLDDAHDPDDPAGSNEAAALQGTDSGTGVQDASTDPYASVATADDPLAPDAGDSATESGSAGDDYTDSGYADADSGYSDPGYPADSAGDAYTDGGYADADSGYSDPGYPADSADVAYSEDGGTAADAGAGADEYSEA